MEKIDPSILAILDQGAKADAWIARQVDRDWKEKVARLDAMVQLMQEGVANAFSGPYQPSYRIVMDAVFPSEEKIRARMINNGWKEED